jgi:hypothetical protein
MAAQVAEANGLYIDPGEDVKFGKRVYNEADGTWPIQWNGSPYNVVKVIGRKTDEDVTAPDGQLPLAFGWAVGRSKVPITTSATAFVEARDLVVVLDFSASMNDDSTLNDSAAQAQWRRSSARVSSLQAANPGRARPSKFPSAASAVNSAVGTLTAPNEHDLASLQLNARNGDGSAKYPFRNRAATTTARPK